MTEPTKKKSICGCSMCEFHTTAYEIAVERGDIVDEPSAGAVQNRQTTTSELGEILIKMCPDLTDVEHIKLMQAIEQKYISRKEVEEAIGKDWSEINAYPKHVTKKSSSPLANVKRSMAVAIIRAVNKEKAELRAKLNLKPLKEKE